MKKLITQLVIGCLLSVAIGNIAYEPQEKLKLPRRRLRKMT